MPKGIYHSELDSLTTQQGSVVVTLTKPPSNQSRNKDLAGFANIRDWNGEERYINIENQAVLAALQQAPVGQPIQIRAGGKGDGAWLVVDGPAQGGAVPQSYTPQTQTPQQPQQPQQPQGYSQPQHQNAPGSQPQQHTPQGHPYRQEDLPPEGLFMTPITREHYACLVAAHSVLQAIIEKFPGDLMQASDDAKLEFIRTSANNYRMDLVHNPERPLYSPGKEPQD